jgi:hypothetical protein
VDILFITCDEELRRYCFKRRLMSSTFCLILLSFKNFGYNYIEIELYRNFLNESIYLTLIMYFDYEEENIKNIIEELWYNINNNIRKNFDNNLVPLVNKENYNKFKNLIFEIDEIKLKEEKELLLKNDKNLEKRGLDKLKSIIYTYIYNNIDNIEINKAINYNTVRL